jgi:hypothetical protein
MGSSWYQTLRAILGPGKKRRSRTLKGWRICDAGVSQATQPRAQSITKLWFKKGMKDSCQSVSKIELDFEPISEASVRHVNGIEYHTKTI